MNDWQPENEDETRIVCAACKAPDGFIAAGPRHYDGTMHPQIDAYWRGGVRTVAGWEQGFIDQYGRFYSREEAMAVVKEKDQPFDIERNGGQDQALFSEGLY